MTVAVSPVPELIRLLKEDVAGVLALPPKGHKEVFLARAPGRLDVMGGITDYAGGLVCGLPLDLGAAVAVQRRDDRKLVIKTYNADASRGGRTEDRVELSLDDFYGSAALLPQATLQSLFTGGRHWAAYIAGAFPALAKHKKLTRRSHGANIACYSNVPFGVGLGSSAAVACATLTALMAAFHLILDPMEIARLAQSLEHVVVGAPRGITDQAASVFGRAGELVVFSCQPGEVKGYVKVPEGYLFAGINSGVAPPVGGAEYRKVRTASFMAQAMIAQMYKDFGSKKDPTGGHLVNVPVGMFEKYFKGMLPEEMTGRAFVARCGDVISRAAVVEAETVYRVRAAAEHQVGEQGRTVRFVEVMRAMETAGDAGERQRLAEEAGGLMMASDEAVSRVGLGIRETELFRGMVVGMRGRGVREIYGARVMGSAGGGSVVVLAEDSAAGRGRLGEMCELYRKETGREAKLMLGTTAGCAEGGAVRVGMEALGAGS